MFAKIPVDDGLQVHFGPKSITMLINQSLTKVEACIGVLVIQDICHFTSRDIGYYPFYFQGYGILCSTFWLLSGILNIQEN